jgi:nifR3 family TIM-barrel protein
MTVNIKNVSIEGYAALAPMAGVACRAMRRVAREFGAAFAVGEMASAKGIVLGGKNSEILLEADTERPFAVQLFGADPACMARAAQAAAQYGPDIIDLNFGCPAPKITSGGAGSALLCDLPLAEKIVRDVVRAVGLPVTVKMRKGFGHGHDVAEEAAKRFEDAGAAAITVHGRTRAEMFAPPCDLDCIARVKRAVSVPVIGNGDIQSARDARRMFNETGCDLVMVGRGSLGRPWLFAEINTEMAGLPAPCAPSPGERLAVMRRQIAFLLEDKGESVGFREARKHAAWYMNGLRGAARLRSLCTQIKSLSDIDAVCELALQFSEDAD